MQLNSYSLVLASLLDHSTQSTKLPQPESRAENTLISPYNIFKTKYNFLLLNFLFLLYGVAAGGGYGLGLTTNKDSWQKLVLVHQTSLCEFQRELKFEMEEKIWRQKYSNLIQSTCFIKI